ADGNRNEIDESFRKVGAAGGDVERRGQLALVVVDRRRRAAQKRVARVEMLVAMNSERALLGQTGSDAVGALAVLAPDRPGPQAPRLEGVVVGHSAAPIYRHAVKIGQQHTSADASDRH